MKEWKFKAKTPKGLAMEIKKYLERDCLAEDVNIWNPKKTKEMGHGDFWAVVSEDAPFEWTMGLSGWNKDIANHPTVDVECQNGWMLCLFKSDKPKQCKHMDVIENDMSSICVQCGVERCLV